MSSDLGLAGGHLLALFTPTGPTGAGIQRMYSQQPKHPPPQSQLADGAPEPSLRLPATQPD